MVYLKRLEIRGFKSIGRKVTLDLEQGLTVITGPNGSGKCLTAGTKIATADGDRRVEELFEGARRSGITLQDHSAQSYVIPIEPVVVPALNLSRGEIERSNVLALFQQIVDEETYRIRTETDRFTTTTREHRFLVRGAGKWIKAGLLRRGMLIAVAEGGRLSWESVIDVRKIPRRRQVVYDVSVPFYHNFISATGLVLHNSNVLDAVKFVLGEVSAKSLRTDKFAGVVCDSLAETGTGRTALVRISLDNADRRIPIDENEVVISREVDVSGESVYRLGRTQTQRTALNDLLSVAGLSHRGYNIVLQGEIARIADKDPVERRQEIELSVGIAEYDERKKEAMEQLREADTNVRVAAARMDEVSQRVEQLEAERNRALRNRFLQEEGKKMGAVITSASLLASMKEASAKKRMLSEKAEEYNKARSQQEVKQLQYDEKQKAWRSFTEDILEKGGDEIAAIQTSIGEAQIRRTEASAKMAAAVEAEGRTKSELMKSKIEIKGIHRKMRSERRRIKTGLAHQALMKSNLSREGAILDSKRAKLRKAEKRRGEALRIENETSSEIAQASQDLALLEGTARSEKRRIQELRRELKTSSERRRTLTATLKELARHLNRLLELKRNEGERLAGIDRNVQNRESLVGKVTDEIDELTGLIERVRGAIVQAETRKEIVQSIADEERSVQRILVLKEAGLVDGVLGKLSDLITINDEDRVALEAASDGWLRAVVVKDLKTALICAEALKNDRLGRIKLIPLSEAEGTALNVPEQLTDKVKRAMDIISFGVGIRAAICKVFGDTVVALTRVDAIEASRNGLRAVTSEGEVFEPSGGIVGGYYRSPTDILSLLPPGEAIERLETNLSKLLAFQEKRRSDYAERLRVELTDLAKEKAQTEKGFELIEKEARNIRTEVERITKSLQMTVSNVKKITELIDETNSNIARNLSRRNILRGQIVILGQRLREAQGIIRSTDISAFARREEVASRRFVGEQEALTTLTNKITNSLRNLRKAHEPAARKIRIEMAHMREQNRALSVKIKGYEREVEELGAELEAMALKRDELSNLLGKAREKRKEFDAEMQQLTKELGEVNRIVEVRRDELGKMTIEAERAELQESDKLDELRRLGYDSPVQFTTEDLDMASKMLGEIDKEIQTIGPVNLLAIEQYGQQYKNYKMLSVRRNELEAERTGIIRFMEEIESKKKQAFMQALEKINTSFGQFFEKITSGKAWLQLENAEEPFSGGLDMFVQFPSKSPRLVSAVSGGEKSVSALCFIFAMQELKPAPFYVMDEVDAHLDPRNAERFAELVRERSTSSQMIVITLRDAVASKAHKIFGAYISKGTTQLVEMPQRRGDS